VSSSWSKASAEDFLTIRSYSLFYPFQAWPIKKWTKLDLPNHLGEKEVLEALRDQDGSSGKSPRLRLTEKDGWQKLEGFDEMEWIETHRERLKDAMRGRRSGDLTMEWPAYEY